MKALFTILIIATCSKSLCQYNAFLKTKGGEIGVINYEIQQSSDSLNWNTLAVFYPKKKADSNFYYYPIPSINFYYRVQANMLKNNKYFTKSILVGTTQVLSVSNVSILNKVYQFTIKNESKVAYYIIEQSGAAGIIWTETQRIIPKGDGIYQTTVK